MTLTRQQINANIDKVIALIRQYPERFDMGVVLVDDSIKLSPSRGIPSIKNSADCNTIGCILGYEQIALRIPYDHYNIFPNGAAEKLGLTESQAHELFYGKGERKRATSKEAIMMLRSLKKDKPVVDWDAIFKKTRP